MSNRMDATVTGKKESRREEGVIGYTGVESAYERHLMCSSGESALAEAQNVKLRSTTVSDSIRAVEAARLPASIETSEQL